MKHRLCCVLALFAVLGRADTLPGEEQFLSVPGAIGVTGISRVFQPSELPSSLIMALRQHYSVDLQERFLHSLEGFTFDLNRDGRMEYFVYDPLGSGSGGLSYIVVGEIAGRWRVLTSYQGSLFAFPSRGKWPRLISIGRCGAGDYGKVYCEFTGGRYEATLIEHYERGTITIAYRKKA